MTHSLLCAALAEERSRLFWLLSRFYLAPPDSELLAELNAITASGDESDPGDDFAQAVSCLLRGARTATLHQLQAEHLRLFDGIREGWGPPPPYESLYREGRLYGQITADVVSHYRKSGFSLADEGVGPEDHLGSELKFLALLSYEESRRWRNGTAGAGDEALNAQLSFIASHPAMWVPAYCRSLAVATQCGFFQGVAALTAAGIRRAAEQISGLLEELPECGTEGNRRGELQ